MRIAPAATWRPSRWHAGIALVIAAAGAVAAVLLTALGPVWATAAASAKAPDLGTVDVRGWTATGHVLAVGGLRRGYLLIRPSTASPGPSPGPLPVVVLLHGRNMTPAGMARRSGLLGGDRAIIVVPAGFDRSWNAGACCAAAHKARIDDVTFLSRVVGQVLATQPDADHRAVYLEGYSNGGRMAYRMACQRPGMFSAVAAVEAVPVDACASVSRPVPLLIIASSNDPLLRLTPNAPAKPIEGYPQPSVEDALRSWRTLDGCVDAPVRRAAGRLTSQVWTTCRGGSKVGLDVYAGGSHAWPAGAAGTPSAQSELWAFFLSRGAQPASPS